ncbi:hypothetical protein C1645_817152 [Glomus cerebriforme]|uniref:Uncharacterized protein n=1 Tax=Glomus cerebriforme TaxID=658196 RepID=A0A397TAY8_9GLOM|nr:hypothetical protein C1645_817152 [Glomus cerebriforme]
MPVFDFSKINLKSKELQLTALVVLGIFTYHFISSHHIKKDQKSVESRMCRNQQKDLDRTNIRPLGRGPETYDPRIDYTDLVWQLYYESHKGEEEAEKLKKKLHIVARMRNSILHDYNQSLLPTDEDGESMNFLLSMIDLVILTDHKVHEILKSYNIDTSDKEDSETHKKHLASFLDKSDGYFVNRSDYGFASDEVG